MKVMEFVSYMPETASDDGLPEFYYAEECGLSLFKHRKSGKMFYMDKECWNDLARCLHEGRS